MGYTAVSVTILYILSNILISYELCVFNYRRYCKSSRLADNIACNVEVQNTERPVRSTYNPFRKA